MWELDPSCGQSRGRGSEELPVTKQAQQIGQVVRVTVKYDGLTAEAAGVTCFQTLHLEVIMLLDGSYNL